MNKTTNNTKHIIEDSDINMIDLAAKFEEFIENQPEEYFKMILKLSKEGSVETQLELANCYINGIGTKKDNKKAIKILLKARVKYDNPNLEGFLADVYFKEKDFFKSYVYQTITLLRVCNGEFVKAGFDHDDIITVVEGLVDDRAELIEEHLKIADVEKAEKEAIKLFKNIPKI
ncbi:MAG: hypothetical protein GY793_10690 [Proteobacteria bacterium]|nr:hypothetical protein [Pseudomonadota bacterium]